MMKKSYEPCLTLFASSYVTIIYFTRTFSNSLEAVFFTLTIYIICKLLYSYGANDAKSCFLHIRRLYYESYSLGIIFGVGFFNRPTFVCYTLLPLAVWLHT
ncbi:GPI mannosyltransferase 4, partial [Stegodyphus mimosarum]